MTYKIGNCVYIVSNRENLKEGAYKIGMTRNINQRIRSFRTFSGSKIQVIDILYVDDMAGYEKDLKLVLKSKRYLHGQGGTEWYKFDSNHQAIQSVRRRNIYNPSYGFLQRLYCFAHYMVR